MIRLSDITLRRGTEPLLEHADLTIHPGDKIGLVGPNGCGKSTLFALLLGQLEADAGDLRVPREWIVAHMAQQIRELERKALDYVLDGDTAYRAAESEVAEADASGDGERIAHAHQALDDADGFDAPARAGALLNGLGFSAEEHDKTVGEFSGGWRIRLSLARALMCPSDLLLLDEPTNHLDLDMRHALTLALQGFDGAVVTVSHDRHLLSETVDAFWLVGDGGVRPFSGGLEAYRKLISQPDAKPSDTSGTTHNRKAQRQRKAAERERIKPLTNRIKKLGGEIEKLEARKDDLQKLLADTELYQAERADELQRLLSEEAQTRQRLESLEEEWLTAEEELDSLRSSA